MAKAVERVYADALFELSVEEGTLDVTFEELKALKEIFDENKELVSLLASPVVSEDEKHDIIKNIFEGRVSETTFNFLCVLADKGRAGFFDKIVDAFHSLYNTQKGILDVEVVTSEPLNEALEKKLAAKLEESTGKKVNIRKTVDKSILGGIVVRYENTEIDGSVKKRLADIRKSIDSYIA